MQNIGFLNSLRMGVNIVLIAVFSAYALNWLPNPFLQRLDSMAYDLRLRAAAGYQPDAGQIVIIDIDEKSLAAEGRWPWPRAKLAQLIQALFAHEAISLLGIDMVFAEAGAEQSSANPRALDAGDALLAQRLRAWPVVLSFFTTARPLPENPAQGLPQAWFETGNSALAAHIPRAEGFGADLRLFQNAAGDGGYFNNPAVDADGAFRRLPLLTNYQGRLYPALALAMFRRHLGNVKLELLSPAGKDEAMEGMLLGGREIRTAADSSILVSYRKKTPGFKYYSATDALHGALPRGELRDKIALLGSTAAGLMDLRSTPVQNVFPGVEIHATVLENLLSGNIKYKPYYWQAFEVLEMLGIGVASLIFFASASPIWNILRFMCLAGLIAGGNAYLWMAYNIDSLLASPLALLSVLFFNQFTFAYYVEVLNKRHLSKMFGLYIPTEIVQQMVKSGARYDVAAESRRMTVFFSDVKGFTAIAENLPPETLSSLMRELLSMQTEVIHDYHGTIDKYMGDAVMAFWGAPLHDDNHAARAIAAGLTITQRMQALNRSFRDKGWPEVYLGIGVNSGKMSVGNMGSNFRMAYTVLGDAVNLGQRLESLCRYYRTPIIVGEETKKLAPEFIYRELDRVTVKGKIQVVTLFQPLDYYAYLGSPGLQRAEREAQALLCYRERRWGEAEQAFSDLLRERPDDYWCQLYLHRIAEFQAAEPGEDWQGVFEHEK